MFVFILQLRAQALTLQPRGKKKKRWDKAVMFSAGCSVDVNREQST